MLITVNTKLFQGEIALLLGPLYNFFSTIQYHLPNICDDFTKIDNYTQYATRISHNQCTFKNSFFIQRATFFL